MIKKTNKSIHHLVSNSSYTNSGQISVLILWLNEKSLRDEDVPELIGEVDKLVKKQKEETKLELNLQFNLLQARSCKLLSRANWSNLQGLYLNGNKIGENGCRYIIKPHWPFLKILDLYNNQIGAKQCKILVKGQWMSLVSLSLYFNKINQEGCRHLSKAQWPSLQTLDVQGNPIRQKGVLYLINKYRILYYDSY